MRRILNALIPQGLVGGFRTCAGSLSLSCGACPQSNFLATLTVCHTFLDVGRSVDICRVTRRWIDYFSWPLSQALDLNHRGILYAARRPAWRGERPGADP